MEEDEERRTNRGLEFETDDEENEGHHLGDSDASGNSPYSSSTSSGTGDLYDDHFDDEGAPSSYQFIWPQSYRQSIDVYSSLPSPNVDDFLSAGSILIRRGSSLFKQPPPPAAIWAHDDDHLYSSTVHQPLVDASPQQSTFEDCEAAYGAAPSRASIGFPSYIDLPPPHLCSTGQAVLNGINVLCGVGILTTPYALKQGGWLGMLSLPGFGIIACYTGLLLKRCLDSSPGLKTYPDIGQSAFGSFGRYFISIVFYLELYGSCVEYIILVSDSLSSMFPATSLSLAGIFLSSRPLFAVVTTFLVLPTVWVRNLSVLSYFSAGGIVATALVILCLFWVGIVDRIGFHPGGKALDLAHLPVALGLYGFCYSGHSVFPNIYSSMRFKGQFIMVLISCFVLVTILYSGVAATGYMMFGESVESQFTLNMPHEYTTSKIAIWTTILNPLTKYAMTMNPVALSIEELLPNSHSTRANMLLIRTLLVLSTLVVGLTVPFFGLVMSLLGSVFTMLVALILPSACYLSIFQGSVSHKEICANIFVILIGVACSIIGTYSSVKQILSS